MITNYFKTTYLYYLIVSVGQEIGHGLARSFAQDLSWAAIKVLARTGGSTREESTFKPM